MQELITRATSAVKSVYGRTIIALLIAILFYNLKFGVIPVVAIFLLNSYLSDNRNEAFISGAIFGYLVQQSIIVSNIVTHHQSGSIVMILALPVFGGIVGFVLSGLVYVLKQRNLIWVLLSAVVAAGFPIWITSYQQFTNSKIPLLLSLILLAIVTAVTTIQTEPKAKRILFLMMTGFLIALIIKFRLDFLEDSTSHNLLPFELIGELILGVFFTAIGFGFGVALKKKYSEDDVL